MMDDQSATSYHNKSIKEGTPNTSLNDSNDSMDYEASIKNMPLHHYWSSIRMPPLSSTPSKQYLTTLSTAMLSTVGLACALSAGMSCNFLTVHYYDSSINNSRALLPSVEEGVPEEDLWYYKEEMEMMNDALESTSSMGIFCNSNHPHSYSYNNPNGDNDGDAATTAATMQTLTKTFLGLATTLSFVLSILTIGICTPHLSPTSFKIWNTISYLSFIIFAVLMPVLLLPMFGSPVCQQPSSSSSSSSSSDESSAVIETSYCSLGSGSVPLFISMGVYILLTCWVQYKDAPDWMGEYELWKLMQTTRDGMNDGQDDSKLIHQPGSIMKRGSRTQECDFVDEEIGLQMSSSRSSSSNHPIPKLAAGESTGYRAIQPEDPQSSIPQQNVLGDKMNLPSETDHSVLELGLTESRKEKKARVAQFLREERLKKAQSVRETRIRSAALVGAVHGTSSIHSRIGHSSSSAAGGVGSSASSLLKLPPPIAFVNINEQRDKTAKSNGSQQQPPKTPIPERTTTSGSSSSSSILKDYDLVVSPVTPTRYISNNSNGMNYTPKSAVSAITPASGAKSTTTEDYGMEKNLISAAGAVLPPAMPLDNNKSISGAQKIVVTPDRQLNNSNEVMVSSPISTCTGLRAIASKEEEEEEEEEEGDTKGNSRADEPYNNLTTKQEKASVRNTCQTSNIAFTPFDDVSVASATFGNEAFGNNDTGGEVVGNGVNKTVNKMMMASTQAAAQSKTKIEQQVDSHLVQNQQPQQSSVLKLDSPKRRLLNRRVLASSSFSSASTNQVSNKSKSGSKSSTPSKRRLGIKPPSIFRKRSVEDQDDDGGEESDRDAILKMTESNDSNSHVGGSKSSKSSVVHIVSPEPKTNRNPDDPDVIFYQSESSLSELSLPSDGYNSSDDDYNFKQQLPPPPVAAAAPILTLPNHNHNTSGESSADENNELSAVIAGVQQLNRKTSGKITPLNKRQRRRRNRNSINRTGSDDGISSGYSSVGSLLDEVIVEEGELNMSNEVDNKHNGGICKPQIPDVIDASPSPKKRSIIRGTTSKGYINLPDDEEEYHSGYESGKLNSDAEESFSSRAARARRNRILSKGRQRHPSLENKNATVEYPDDEPLIKASCPSSDNDGMIGGMNYRPHPTACENGEGNVGGSSVTAAWQARKVRMARLRMNRAPHAAESETEDVIRAQDGMALACTSDEDSI